MRFMTRSVSAIVLMATAAIAHPDTAAAQASPPAILTSTVTRTIMLPATADPSLSRTAIDPSSSAAIVTGANGTRGEFKLGLKVHALTFLNLTVSTPAKAGRAQLVLGDELPGGTKIEVAGSRIYWLSTPLDIAKVGNLSLAAVTDATEVQAYQEEAFARTALRTMEKDGVGLVLTPGFEYGRERFDYRESATGIDREDQLHETWGGALAAGLMIYRAGAAYPTYVGFSFRRGHSWEENDATQECAPKPDSTTLTCEDVVIDAPKKIEKESYGIELRQRFAERFGWVPQLSYDSKQDKGKRWKAEVPFYLTGSGKGEDFKLTGGVAFGYKQGSGAYAAVFVGPTFPLLPGVNRQQEAQALRSSLLPLVR